MTSLTTLTVTEPVSRLDRFLHLQYPAVSTNRWRRALQAGEVMIDGCRAVKGAALFAGQTISFAVDLPARLAPEKPLPDVLADLEILYHDENLLALNKPAGCHSHPLTASETGTLVNQLITLYPELAGVGEFGSLQPGLLNRLDYATSGIVLVARNNKAWRDVRQQFVEHLIRKEYIAAVDGRFSIATVIEKDLTHDFRDRRRMVITPPAEPCRGFYPARTEVFPIAYEAAKDVSLVRLVMYSGVMHQLRVHLADAGYPVSGDTLYGGKPITFAGEQDAEVEPSAVFHLHCSQLTLANGRVIEAPLPQWYKILAVS